MKPNAERKPIGEVGWEEIKQKAILERESNGWEFEKPKQDIFPPNYKEVSYNRLNENSLFAHPDEFEDAFRGR